MCISTDIFIYIAYMFLYIQVWAPHACACTSLRPAEAHNGSQVCVFPSAIHRHHIYLFMHVYIYSGWQCMHPACKGENWLPAHSSPQHQHTAMIFLQTPGIDLIILCRHRPKSPAVGHQHLPDLLWIYMGHLNANWATYRSSTLFSPCPAHTPRSQQDFAQGPRGML